MLPSDLHPTGGVRKEEHGPTYSHQNSWPTSFPGPRLSFQTPAGAAQSPVSACPVQVKRSSRTAPRPLPTTGTAHPSAGNPATMPGPLALPNTTQSFHRLW